MRIFAWVRSFLFQNGIKQNSSLKLLKLVAICLMSFVLILALGLQGYAQVRRAAVVNTITFGSGNRNMFQLISSANALSRPIAEIPVAQRRIDGQGRLSIPNDGGSQASFYFEKKSDSIKEIDYGGLVVQTRPDKSTKPPTTNYRYPCEFDGQLIIAWPSSSQARTCDNRENGRIEIVTNPQLPSDSTLPSKLSSKQIYSVKKNRKISNDNLVVSPGSEATLIRTVRKSYTKYEPDIQRCDRSFIGDHCQIDSPFVKQGITIEVLEGNILVESERNFLSSKVRKGQKYSYPDDKVEGFDVEEASTSCETLKFLNPAYWLNPYMPSYIVEGITQQLEEHKKSVGLAGKPPKNLSKLENTLVMELNNLRSNPSFYADLLKQQKLFYYANWLKLPGEKLDPIVRVKAVDEAISFLYSQRALPKFSVSAGLSMASRDHVTWQGQTGKNFGHTGDNADGYWDRIARHGTVACGMSENVSYYDARLANNNIQTEARIALFELIIDDGQRQAGSRENIFNQDFQVIGVACGSHGNFLRKMCDITYANGYLEN